MRIVYVVGTRPNFVKMAPVIAALRRRLPDGRHAIVHTGQHYDRLMSEIFLDELGVPPPDHMLGVGSGSHGEQTARVIERLEPVLDNETPDLVLVPGDVNSTLAAALTAAKMEIRLGHVESGLRSFDRSMPEEINRVVTDQLSDLLFLHSEDAEENLRREGVPDERMHFVGNTMIDTLVSLEDRFRSAGAPQRLGLEPGRYLLVTLHRPALVDGPLLADAMRSLAEVARELPVVFPVHPRTRKMLGRDDEHPGVTLTDPVGYLDFLSLEADAAAVLTDSGRDPGGDHLPRDPLLHAARQHRAPGHRAGRNQHRSRSRSGADHRDSGAAGRRRRRAPGRPAAVGRPCVRARRRRDRRLERESWLPGSRFSAKTRRATLGQGEGRARADERGVS